MSNLFFYFYYYYYFVVREEFKKHNQAKRESKRGESAWVQLDLRLQGIQEACLP